MEPEGGPSWHKVGGEEIAELGVEPVPAHEFDEEAVVGRGEELGYVEAQHGRDEALLPSPAYVGLEEFDSVDGGFLPRAAKLAGVEDSMFVEIELETVTDGFFQPFRRAAEEDNGSVSFEFRVVRLVWFGYDDSDCPLEFFGPYSV